MTPFLSLASFCLAVPLGYAGLRTPRRAGAAQPASSGSIEALSPPARTEAKTTPPTGNSRRAVLWALGSVAVLAAPWWLPDVAALRFIVSVCSVLAFIRLTETWLGKGVPGNTRSFSSYLWYFTFFGDIRLHARHERSAGRAKGARRLGRGALKALALLALFVASTVWPELWDSHLLRTIWCLWAGYFGATGAADVVSGSQMVASGHGCSETFVRPIVARSPGDFWGRRWNLVFRNASHRVLFQRIARRFGAAAAGAVVFAWSIVAHEYLVVATLGYTHGDMALFFGLQGLMTLILSRNRRRQPWPPAVAVTAHWAWMIATAPLFFRPVLAVFPVHEWRLW